MRTFLAVYLLPLLHNCLPVFLPPFLYTFFTFSVTFYTYSPSTLLIFLRVFPLIHFYVYFMLSSLITSHTFVHGYLLLFLHTFVPSSLVAFCILCSVEHWYFSCMFCLRFLDTSLCGSLLVFSDTFLVPCYISCRFTCLYRFEFMFIVFYFFMLV